MDILFENDLCKSFKTISFWRGKKLCFKTLSNRHKLINNEIIKKSIKHKATNDSCYSINAHLSTKQTCERESSSEIIEVSELSFTSLIFNNFMNNNVYNNKFLQDYFLKRKQMSYKNFLLANDLCEIHIADDGFCFVTSIRLYFLKCALS